MKDLFTKKNIIELIIILIFSIFLYSSIIINFRSIDTYNIETVNGIKQYSIKRSFSDGRLFMGCICLITEVLTLSIQTLVTFDIICAIIILSICTICFKDKILEILQNKENEIPILLISYVLFFNFMMTDSMQFIENIVIAASIFFYYKAAQKLVVDKKTILSFIFVTIGMFLYQATVCFFLQMVLFYMLLTDKQIKSVVKSIIIVLISIFLNYIFIKIYGIVVGYSNIRIDANIISNLYNILKNFKVLVFQSCGQFFDYIWILCVIYYFIILLMYNTRNKNKFDYFLETIVITIYSIMVAISTLLVYQIDFFGNGRLFFTIGSLLPILFMYLIIKTNILKEKIIKSFFIVLISIYFIVNIISIYQITYSYKRANIFDKQICDKIVKYVEEYEQKNNVKVCKIINDYSDEFINNKKIPIRIREVAMKNSITLCALPISGLIKLYTNREFENASVPHGEMVELFKETELEETFSDKNIKIIDDIVYVYF